MYRETMDDDFNASVNFATDFDLDSNALEKIAESGYKRKLARINSNVSQEASKIDAWLQEEESVMRERFNTTLATLRKALAKRGANMRQTVPKVKAAHLTSLALIKSSHDRVQLAKHKLNRHEQEYKKEIAALREGGVPVHNHCSNEFQKSAELRRNCLHGWMQRSPKLIELCLRRVTCR
eukprot:Blabericola_migrator_1__6556@NODE_3303_length_1878_cov_60_017670_g2064_i0_p2_GENE_NODE_3303_length_1878_cov_60_017670_g2064_i0NODE_3303_length_1878_cov_60_017670_g2064_i0_p2_ORF_typecomplete_len180_score29_23DUF1640/PF07798_11/0_02tRNAsynt_2c/PF01411_19/0_053DUF4709/PF15821_5/0_77DUF4709/PF15821_5/36FAM184/PF15665_5/0_085Phage_Mu_Gam/PF07352_12/0_54Phage_Mu_Gam/PF07352_12/22Phage_gp53/PF11246_8/0_18Fzo_mitofusin/PF04799_13/0_65Fzo_mitofusin/PF04799_13/2_2e02BAR_2/PF10455_9/0_43CCCAP/PF15964_5/1_